MVWEPDPAPRFPPGLPYNTDSIILEICCRIARFFPKAVIAVHYKDVYGNNGVIPQAGLRARSMHP